MANPLTKEERNALIYQAYLDGSTQSELAERFNISEAWVGQLLHKKGLVKEDRPSPKRRPVFIGVHLSSTIKKALKQEADREETSMSAWVSSLVTSELKQRGINVTEPNSTEVEEFLPFEGAE